VIRSNDPWRAASLCLGLMLVTLALYWPARQYDFVQYDDPEYVVENHTVSSGLSWWGLQWAIVDAHAANWHPLTWLSHMLDCQLFGLNAGAHHLVNVLLHCANSALLFLLLRAITGSFWRSAFVAALFAWHPLRVESVAWVSERKDVLSGFFFVLTLWAYTRYAKEAEKNRPLGTAANPHPTTTTPISDHRPLSSRFYALALICFTLGLLSKPMLVTVPCILLLVDYWPLNRFGFLDPGAIDTPESGRRRWRLAGPLLREKIPFFLLSLAVGLLTFSAQRGAGTMNSAASEGIVFRIGNVLAGYSGYLEKLVWPRDLTVLYLRPASPPILTVVVGSAILVVFFALAVGGIRRRPYIAVGGLWFGIILLPVSGLIPVGLQSIADRYTYLPAIGLGLAVAWGAADLAAALRFGRTRRVLLGAAATAMLIACAVLTRHQLPYWENTETLMSHALQVDPGNYVAHENLGVYYSKRGQTEAARAHRQRACELDPALRQNADKPTAN
jgi:hypothetical protein